MAGNARTSPDLGDPAYHPTGAFAAPLQSGDFNRDGVLDLVYATEGAIAVLPGRGDGTFGQAVATPVTERYARLVVADLDRDGRPDVVGLVPGYYGSAYSAIHYGNGDGSFQGPVAALPPGQYGAAGDVDGDGDVDLVIWNWESWPDDSGWSSVGYTTVNLNDGHGGFQLAFTTGFYNSSYGLELVDYDRDGDLDLVIVDSSLATLDGAGDGTFGNDRHYASDWQSQGLVSGDFNGDGTIDLVSGPGYYGYFVLNSGRGDGAFDGGPQIPSGARSAPAAADFNGDGALDLISTDYQDALVLLGVGNGGFGAPIRVATGSSGWSGGIVAEDFDRDGRPDVAVSIGYDIVVLHNDGDWPPTPPPQPPVVSIASQVEVNEGNDGEPKAVFSVKLDKTYPEPVTVNYSTMNGSAEAAADFWPVSGVLTFAPGEKEKFIEVPVFGDRVAEYDEYFSVVLSEPVNAVIGTGAGLATILDDEPEIWITYEVVNREGRKGQNTNFTFTITLSQAYDQPVTVKYATADDTAKVKDQDYIGVSGTMTFPPGTTSKTVNVVVKGDNKREPSEIFYIRLSDQSPNARIGLDAGHGYIVNDD